MKKDKLLFVIPSLAGGGAERSTLNLIKGLVKSYKIVLVLLKKEIKYEIPQGLEKLYCLNKKNRWSFFALVFKLLVIVHKEKPPVVFSVLEDAHLVVYFVRIFVRKKFYWIINDRSIQSIAIRERNFSKIRFLIMKSAYYIADRIIVVSKAIKNDLIKNFNVKEDKIAVVYNGVDIEKIQTLAEEEVKDDVFFLPIPKIISVGRLEKEKGYDVLLRSFQLLTQKIDSILILVGDGREKQNLKKLAESLGIKEKVVFLPFQSNPWKYMKNSTVFVLPSKREGFSLVACEAQICGIPVVATRCGGVQEIIEDKKTGLLVDVENVVGLAEAVERILVDDTLRKNLIENAKQQIKKFDLDTMIENYKNIIRGVIVS